MSEADRKKVVLCLFTVWILLFAFCFAEQFGYFHDTDEYADQGVEQALSSPLSPLSTDQQTLEERLATFTFIGLIGIAIAVSLKALPLICQIVSIKEHYSPPGSPKIYQLISIYRI